MNAARPIEKVTREPDSHVKCQTHQGLGFEGPLLRITHHLAVFEIYDATIALRLSETLKPFEIVLQNRVVYSGQATVSKFVHTGTAAVCEVTLEDHWQDAAQPRGGPLRDLSAQYSRFLQEWQKLYQVESNYKLAIADIQTFCTDLRIWLEQLEWRLAAEGPANPRAEADLLREISPGILESLDLFFDRFEQAADRVPLERVPVHQIYARRQLHSLALASPFAARTYRKPLGYAGDYEMVSMIARNPHEGPSLFAKILNAWFLRQAPAEAHRNRVEFLFDRLQSEGLRALRTTPGDPFSLYNLGCGPALEIRRFLREFSPSSAAELTLVDFNRETLDSIRRDVEALCVSYRRTPQMRYDLKSVTQLLKDAARNAPTPQYHLVYCAGLLDYLSDQVSKLLVELLYQKVRPGGLLLVTNVDKCNPRRQTMEAVLDWHLIYRDGQHMRTLKPAEAHPSDCTVSSDVTGVNVYLEVRKPSKA